MRSLELGGQVPQHHNFLQWSLETTRCGYKINMAAISMEVMEDKINVVVKIETGIHFKK